MPLRPPQISQELSKNGTWTSRVRSHRLTAWSGNFIKHMLKSLVLTWQYTVSPFSTNIGQLINAVHEMIVVFFW